MLSSIVQTKAHDDGKEYCAPVHIPLGAAPSNEKHSDIRGPMKTAGLLPRTEVPKVVTNPPRNQPMISRSQRGQWAKHLERAREKGTHTPEEWETMKRLYKYHCVRCRQKTDGRNVRLTKDHIVPLCKGGDDSITNIQPVCPQCNSRKSNKCKDYRLNWPETPLEYLPIQGPQPLKATGGTQVPASP